ncbi:MAG: ornithine carbamoyltransferase [Alphaproteobacteria bacterium]
MTKRDFIDISLLSKKDVQTILDLAHLLKRRKTDESRPLDNQTLISIFEKTSTRTRVSFEVGIQQLGGHNVIITNKDSQLGKGETVEDTAKVLSRFGDIIMARTNSHAMVETLAQHADVPVINGLSDYSHPCQIMADIMTYEEHIGSIQGAKIAWVGDGNNVCHSWIHAAEKLGFTLHIACPKKYMPCEQTVQAAINNGADIVVSNDVKPVVDGADCVVADTWVSMGDADVEERIENLKPYQVNDTVMSYAKDSAIFMHCLPAYRGNEMTASVIDGKQSVVFDEAENRLHAQKAIMVWVKQCEDKL